MVIFFFIYIFIWTEIFFLLCGIDISITIFIYIRYSLCSHDCVYVCMSVRAYVYMYVYIYICINAHLQHINFFLIPIFFFIVDNSASSPSLSAACVYSTVSSLSALFTGLSSSRFVNAHQQAEFLLNTTDWFHNS